MPSKQPDLFGRISFTVEDSPLPFSAHGPPPEQLGEDGEQVPTTPLLTVADILGPDSPYRQIDPHTGQEIINEKGLHITHMDMENVRQEVNSRIITGQRLMKELDELAATAELQILRNGPDAVTICVDTKKNINLRMGIRRVYGQKTSCITFEMYKFAVNLRGRLAKEDINNVLEDFNLGESWCEK